MPGSAASASSNTKALQGGSVPSNSKQQHPSNPYQGNNGLQNASGAKGPTSSFLSSSQQKEDSPSSIDANSSSHQTKTKAMLKGKLFISVYLICLVKHINWNIV